MKVDAVLLRQDACSSTCASGEQAQEQNVQVGIVRSVTCATLHLTDNNPLRRPSGSMMWLQTAVDRSVGFLGMPTPHAMGSANAEFGCERVGEAWTPSLTIFAGWGARRPSVKENKPYAQQRYDSAGN